MMPMTERFAAGIRHHIDTRGPDLVRFTVGTGLVREPAHQRLHRDDRRSHQLVASGWGLRIVRFWRRRA